MNRNDTLAERLRMEANDERPAFSAERHRQLMSQIRHQSVATRRVPRLVLAYAAALFLIASVTAIIAWRAARPAQPISPMANAGSKIAEPQPISPPPPHPVRADQLLAFHVGEIFAGQLWPPRLAISLPLPSSVPPPRDAQPANESAALPQWLIAKIEETPHAETRALVDVLPDDFKTLARTLAARLFVNRTP